MTGVEVLGALASAAQIAFYVIQTSSMIIEQFKRLRNAAIKFQQHSDTATQLIGISRVVQSNQWLQTESMASLLKGILGRVEEVHKLLPSLRKEDRILAIFAGLEEQKSALALNILEIQTRYTGETSNNVTKLLPMVDSIQEDVSHIRRGTGVLGPTISSNRSILTKSSTANHPSTPTPSTLTSQDTLAVSARTPHPLDRETESPSTVGRELTLVESPTAVTTFSHPPDPSLSNPNLKTCHFQTHIRPQGLDQDLDQDLGQDLAHIYDTPLANSTATQINGDISIGAPARTQAHRYSRPTAAGNSVQMNGNISGADAGVLRVVMGRV